MSISVEGFRELVASEMESSRGNDYGDNWDHHLFGEYKEVQTLQGRLKPVVAALVPKRTYSNLLINKYLGKHLAGISELYDHLADQSSKDLLVKIMAYRILGHKKVKLPLNTPDYWDDFKKVESLVIDNSEKIDIPFLNIKLRQYNLASVGFPVSLFFMPVGIMADFIVKQYIYNVDGTTIGAAENDVVIDAGGCWGDTALFFAHEVGKNGKVYSFEFVPGNIEIFQRNLALNPALGDRVELVNRPVWDESGKDVFYTNNGPGSVVSMTEFDNYFGKTTTLSIDDLVTDKNIPHVDFIKMDIEGAEPFALKGAKKTLQQFKPNLAISIYHDLEHFYSIMRFIDSLGLGYRFHLKHATIHSYETILFATAR